MRWIFQQPPFRQSQILIAFAALTFFPFQATAAAWQDCGPRLQLQISSPISSQGSLLLVEARATSPLEELRANWAEQKLLFWRDEHRQDIQRALLAIDLEKPAGTYDLTLTGHSDEGTACSIPITIRRGRFAVERLRVAKQFVDLDAADLELSHKQTQRLREFYATVTPERLWRGNFGLPLGGTRKAGNFGRRRILNGEPGSPHTGVDFSAPAGTPVHAVQRGRVVLAENLFFSGNTVLLDHGLGIYTLYGHFESTAVSVGDLVEAGTILGRVGATGRATGPHLHWGLVVNGARVNPLQIVTLFGSDKAKVKSNGAHTKLGTVATP